MQGIVIMKYSLEIILDLFNGNIISAVGNSPWWMCKITVLSHKELNMYKLLILLSCLPVWSFAVMSVLCHKQQVIS